MSCSQEVRQRFLIPSFRRFESYHDNKGFEMIKIISNTKKYCSEDISLIENYDLAILSNEIYDIHHRLETHDKNGNLLNKSLSAKKLIQMGLYYNRPAEELIFLSHSEHQKLHHSFLEIKTIHSENMKYLNKNIIKHNKGKRIKRTLEHNEKISKSIRSLNQHNNIGTHWYNNGVKSIRAFNCPEGYVEGRL